MFMNKEKRLAKKIKELLNKRGFIVKDHCSKSSKSIYIKIDNGAIPVIRISDHKRLNDDNCKYNVIRNYKGSKNEFINGKMKKYYNHSSIGRLITDIELERNAKILSMGYSKYKNILRGKKTNNYDKYPKVA